MSNPMRYIKNLEAAGFERVQAEAQVQMVLDALEGDLATKADFSLLESNFRSGNSLLRSEFKSDFSSLRSEVKSDLASLRSEFKNDLAVFKEQIDNRFIQVDNRFTHVEGQMREMELRLVTRLGFITATSTSIAVGLLAWLIKV